MQFPRFAQGALVATTLLAAAAASQAAVTVVTTAAVFNAAIAGGASGTDNLADLTINTFLTGPLVRSAGSFGYTASTSTSNSASTSGGDFYVAPVAGTLALSVENSTDSIVLDSFSSIVRAVGGNFFNTNVLGEYTGGDVIVVINDVNGGSFSNTITPTSAASFRGFLSDVNISSVRISNSGSTVGPWESYDNLTLAVPEPASAALTLMGLLAIAGFVRRQTRA